MNISAPNLSTLIDAIKQANASPHTEFVVTLTGDDSAYVVTDAPYDMFGATAFTPISGHVVIQGQGRTIARADHLSRARFFGVESPVGTLMLHDLTLAGGNSGRMGGGAIVNNRLLYAKNCTFRGCSGSHGGAVYNGDGQTAIFDGCTFEDNTGLVEGGAIFNAAGGCCVVTNTTFCGNRVDEGKQADIYLHGIERATVLHRSTFDAGIALSDAILPLDGGDMLVAKS